MKITIKTESHPDIVSSPVICGISIDGVMSQNDVRDALSEIDKFANMFFNKHINKYGNEPDPHDFLANAKRDEPWEDQIANKAKTQVHALKNLAESGCDATADTKAENIYDLIDALVNQIKIQGVKEESNKAKERAKLSFIPDPNAQPLDLAVLTEIAQLRKENHELKEWNDKLNECCNLLESEVQMLKAKIYDIQNKEK